MLNGNKCHILLLPCPAQGHINPILQFGKRLASHNLLTTLVNTRFLSNSTKSEPGPVNIQCISDGFDPGGMNAAPSRRAYFDRPQSRSGQKHVGLIESLRSRGRPGACFGLRPVPLWAMNVAERSGLRSVAFFTQPCAVDTIYRHVWEGRIKVPVAEPVRLPGLPPLEPSDLPCVRNGFGRVVNPDLLPLRVNQHKNLDKADMMGRNSIYELEADLLDGSRLPLPVKSIGPTVPSTYLDNRIPSDSHYGFNLYTPDTTPYLDWLDSKAPNSVIYVSFGSLSSLSPDQTNEIASGLIATNKSFIWVVRTSELAKLPANFTQENASRGLVVTWCDQLDLLAHVATGCFVTHCGWNSTMEGVALGVPMVGVPQWSDQPMNAKYVEDVWKVGVRAKTYGKDFVRGEEFKRCVEEVMDGERSGKIRENAARWCKLAKDSVSEGGSSDKCIKEFIHQCCNDSKISLV
uniref:Crocetin glucosyltransferase 2 n=1 Tax=Crocus sativus TaxID=82528 RepID=GLT2_CROSA|nr:RecName: Full=Crocetin glucosyltransferase 2 [Crocus sativus]AAP94878.1 glucosyltransferase 2 [Crocus sativus]AFP28219.1 glucosyltransferase [synthetic construct]